MNTIFALIVAVFICELAGLIGQLFTAKTAPAWYAGLRKPPLAPPDSIFGPVWTTLYLLMGIAAFLVWQNGLGQNETQAALIVFGIQLLLNVAWAALFFGAHSSLGAFIDLIFLWMAIVWTIAIFAPISAVAAYLLIPYLLWVIFAGYLNYEVWRLN